MELVSVVIPVYNAEEYLLRCIDTIRNQSYKNMQIILVDDGSTDVSGKMCDIFAEQDERICVIHTVNKGVSNARNVGIDIAKGDYITFVDSDDFVRENYIEFMLKLIKDSSADIVQTSYQKYYSEHDSLKSDNKNMIQQLMKFSGEEAVANLCYQKYISNAPWAKLYRRNLFDEVRFPVGVSIGEDLGTIYKLLLKSETVVCSNYKNYYYVQRVGSAMNSKFSLKQMDRITISETIYNDIKLINEDLRRAAISRMFISNIQVFGILPANDSRYGKEREEITRNIKKYRTIVLRDRKAKIMNRCIAGFTFLPLGLVKRLNNVHKYVFR